LTGKAESATFRNQVTVLNMSVRMSVIAARKFLNDSLIRLLEEILEYAFVLIWFL
jgi:hypothetical protein